MRVALIAILLGSLLASSRALVVKRQVNGCYCAGNSYDTPYLDDSIYAAETGGAGTYPHAYHDYEGFYFSNCSGTFYEYPIIPGDIIYGGGSPGPDRVIYDDFGDFCACLTHTGAPTYDGFVECSF
ncbi:hypothetical protein AX17_000475 [Amanita inopinata Kibby_2008]|nr:hypothetical protein AX17_000475 [Amanita inopinata Kibby_2008]